MTEQIQKALDMAEEALSQLVSCAIGTSFGQEYQCQIDLALDALRNILEAKSELEAVKKKMIDDSWALYPDRMGQ